jgi:hypothetical protein
MHETNVCWPMLSRFFQRISKVLSISHAPPIRFQSQHRLLCIDAMILCYNDMNKTSQSHLDWPQLVPVFPQCGHGPLGDGCRPAAMGWYHGNGCVARGADEGRQCMSSCHLGLYCERATSRCFGHGAKALFLGCGRLGNLEQNNEKEFARCSCWASYFFSSRQVLSCLYCCFQYCSCSSTPLLNSGMFRGSSRSSANV